MARPSHLIVTVHGIRTYGYWQERLERLVTAEPSEYDVEFINYKFGFFSAVSFAVPFLRWMLVRKFRNELVRLCTVKERARIDLVGHSFGTHVLGWAVAGLPADAKTAFNTVILSGSVLRAAFPWHAHIGTRVQRVVNDCGSRDGILLLSQFLVFFTGMAGRTGFSGSTGATFRNRYSPFGHSGYFQDETGKPSDTYLRRHWVALLTSDAPAPEFDFRAPPTTFDMLVQNVATHAGLIKMAVYLTPFVVLSAVYYNLYNRAEEQRKAALTAESRLLSGVSKETVRGKRAHIGTMFALAALPDTERGRDRPYLPEAELALYRALHDDRSIAVLDGECDFDADVSRAVCKSIESNSTELVEVPSRRSIRRFAELTGSRFSGDAGRLATIHAEGEGSVVRLWNARDGTPIGDLGPGDDVVFSPNGDLMAVAQRNRGLKIWDAGAGRPLHALSAGEFPKFSGGGKYLVAAAGDGVAIIEARTGRRAFALRPWPAGSGAAGIAFSRDESRLAVQVEAGVQVLDASTGATLLRLPRIEAGVDRLAFSRNGERLLVLGRESATAELWDIRARRKIATLGAAGIVSDAKFGPDDTRIAAAFNDDGKRTFAAKLWDGATGREIATLQGHAYSVKGIEFSADATRVVTYADDHRLKLWNAETGVLVADLAGHAAPVERVVFSPDGRSILSLTRQETHVPFDFTARLWDAQSGRLLAVLEHQGAEVEAGFSRDGKWIFTDANVWSHTAGAALDVVSITVDTSDTPVAVAPNGTHVAVAASHDVNLWDTANGSLVSVLKGHGAAINAVAFDPQGARLATASADMTARIWSLRSNERVRILDGHAQPVRKAYFSGGGTRLVTESEDETARVWDAGTGSLLSTVKEVAGEAARTAISQDGRFLVAVAGALGESMGRLLDATTGAQLADLGRADGAVFNAAGSRMVAVCGCEAQLWDVAARKALQTLGSITDAGRVVFSSDGKRLVTYLAPTMTLRDGQTGREIKALDDFPFGASASFSADDSRILVWASGQATSQNLVKIYDARTGELLMPKDEREIGQPNLSHAAFSSDEKKIVISHSQGIARLLDAATLDVLAEFNAATDADMAAVLSRDGTRLIGRLSDPAGGRTRIVVWRVFRTAQALVTFAKDFAPRCRDEMTGRRPRGASSQWCNEDSWRRAASGDL